MSSYEDHPETVALTTKLRNFEAYARQLAADKYDLEHRVQNLTRALGFDSLDQAEESQSLNLPAPRGKSRSHAPPPTSELKALTLRVNELESINDTMTSENNTLSTKLASVNKELEDLQTGSTHRLKQMSDSRQRALDELDKLKAELFKKDAALTKTRTELGEVNATLKTMADSVKKASGDASSLRAHLHSVEAARDKAQRELESASARMTSTALEVTSLQSQLAAARAEIEGMNGLRTALKSSKADFARASHELTLLRQRDTESSELRVENERVKQEAKDIRKRFESLKKVVDSFGDFPADITLPENIGTLSPALGKEKPKSKAPLSPASPTPASKRHETSTRLTPLLAAPSTELAHPEYDALKLKYTKLIAINKELQQNSRDRLRDWRSFKTWIQGDSGAQTDEAGPSTSSTKRKSKASSKDRKSKLLDPARMSALVDENGRSVDQVLDGIIESAEADLKIPDPEPVEAVGDEIMRIGDEATVPAKSEQSPLPVTNLPLVSPTRKRKRIEEEDSPHDVKPSRARLEALDASIEHPVISASHSPSAVTASTRPPIIEVSTSPPTKEEPCTPPRRSTKHLILHEANQFEHPPSTHRLIPRPPLFHEHPHDENVDVTEPSSHKGPSAGPREPLASATRGKPRILVPGTSPDSRANSLSQKARLSSISTPSRTASPPGALVASASKTSTPLKVSKLDFAARMVSLTAASTSKSPGTPAQKPTRAKVEKIPTPRFLPTSSSSSADLIQPPSQPSQNKGKGKASEPAPKRPKPPASNVIDLTFDSQGSETQPLSEDDFFPPRPVRLHNGDEDRRSPISPSSSPYKPALTPSPIQTRRAEVEKAAQSPSRSEPSEGDDASHVLETQPLSEKSPEDGEEGRIQEEDSSIIFLGKGDLGLRTPQAAVATDKHKKPHVDDDGANSDVADTPKPRPHVLAVTRLRQHAVDATPASNASSSSSTRAKPVAMTPKTRSEVPSEFKKPRGPELPLAMTEPRKRPESSPARGRGETVLITRPPDKQQHGRNEKREERGRGGYQTDVGDDVEVAPRSLKQRLLARDTDDEDEANDDSGEAIPPLRPRVNHGSTLINLDGRRDDDLKYSSSPSVLQASLTSPFTSPRKLKPNALASSKSSHLPGYSSTKPKTTTRDNDPGTSTPGAGPSNPKARPEPLMMTRDEREKHFRDLAKLPASEYKKLYSGFKGRGRYAAPAPGSREGEEDRTINARYEIDPDRNGGMDQPYEEVVRGKEARKRMHGTDCECCRAYYEDVGPLPPRLQAPLWKDPSPQSSQEAGPSRLGKRPRSASPETPSKRQRQREREMQEHQQQISRHRHHWSAAKTPPDYWLIGFPNTQQLDDINRRAKEMHEEKRRQIEAEAKKPGGRYRKKT